MIQPTSSVGRGPDLTPHVLGGPERQPLQPLLVAGALEGRLHLAQPRRHPDGALLDDAPSEVGEPLEDAVEDQGGEGLHRGNGMAR